MLIKKLLCRALALPVSSGAEDDRLWLRLLDLRLLMCMEATELLFLELGWCASTLTTLIWVLFVLLGRLVR